MCVAPVELVKTMWGDILMEEAANESGDARGRKEFLWRLRSADEGTGSKIEPRGHRIPCYSKNHNLSIDDLLVKAQHFRGRGGNSRLPNGGW